jgi:Arm DNA-binding domain
LGAILGNAIVKSDTLAPKTALTDKIILEAIPLNKPFKLFDGQGLLLLVVPSGGKWWRFRYRFAGKHLTLSMGVYPEVSLVQARERRDEARQLLLQGIDPGAVRRADKAREVAERLAANNTSSVQVSVAIDGAVEIWKGRAVVRLTSSEARGVQNLLSKFSV